MTPIFPCQSFLRQRLSSKLISLFIDGNESHTQFRCGVTLENIHSHTHYTQYDGL